MNRISNHISLFMTIQILRYCSQNKTLPSFYFLLYSNPEAILNEGSDFDKNLFYRACACRISFLFAVGKGEEAVRQQKDLES